MPHPKTFAAALIAAAMMALPSLAETPTRQITVTGVGEVVSQPDVAIVRLGVIARSESAEDALAEAARTTGAILAVLTEQGIEARDVQTERLDLSPVNRRQQQQNNPTLPDEFEANALMSIRVRDIAQLGPLIDATSKAGANQVRGITFSIDDPAPLRLEAQKRAVADALQKAGALAEAAGVSLGPIISISDQSAGFNPQPMAAARAMADMPIAEGEVSLTGRVSIVIALSD